MVEYEHNITVPENMIQRQESKLMMENLISVHTTKPRHLIFSLILFLMGLLIFAITVLSVALAGTVTGRFIAPAFWGSVIAFAMIVYPFLLVGIPGRPTKQLEIYADGFIYRNSSRTVKWKWASIQNIQYLPAGFLSTGNRSKVSITHKTGATLRMHGLTEWHKAQSQIYNLATSSTYQNIIQTLADGEILRLNKNFRITNRELFFRNECVLWEEVELVQVKGSRAFIYSPMFSNRHQRVSFDMNRIPTGIVFANLIQDLWQTPQLIPLSYRAVANVIDGVRFNSEGEIISYEDEAVIRAAKVE